MTASQEFTGFKGRMIREAESVIDRLIKRRDQLLAEAAELEDEIVEARQVLRALKRPDLESTVVAEPIPGPPPSPEVVERAKELDQREPVEAATTKSKPVPNAGVPRNEIVAHVQRKWRDAVLELGRRPEGFTAKEIGEHLGLSKGAFEMALKSHAFLQRMVTSRMEKRQDKAGRNVNFRVYRYAEPTNGNSHTKQAPKQRSGYSTSAVAVPGTGRDRRPSDDELKKMLDKVKFMGGEVTFLEGGHIRVNNPKLKLTTTLSATSSNKTLARDRLKKIGYKL